MGLVLNRRPENSVVLITSDGTRIIVKVNRVNGKVVSLDFEAPPSVKILRSEIEHRTLDESNETGLVLPRVSTHAEETVCTGLDRSRSSDCLDGFRPDGTRQEKTFAIPSGGGCKDLFKEMEE